MAIRQGAASRKIVGIVSPLRWGAFFSLCGYISGRGAGQRTAGGDGTDAGTGKIVAGQIKNGASPRKRRGLAL